MSETAHEMSTAGGRGHSISAKTFFVVLMITMTIGVVVFVFGTLLYLSGISREYRVNTWQLAVSQAGVLEKEDVEGKAKETLAIYDTFSEVERGDGTAPAYQEKFKGAVDEDFRQMQKKMRKMQEMNGSRNAFVAALDEKHDRMIYIVDADPDPKTFCWPGTWDQYPADQVYALIYGRPSRVFERRYGNGDNIPAVFTTNEKYGIRCTGGYTLCKVGDYVVQVCVDEKLDHVYAACKVFLLQYLALMVCITLLASLVGTMIMRRTVVAPINKMEKAAREYSENRRTEPSSKLFFQDLNINSGDELENLARTMKGMETEMGIYVSDLTKITAERERIRTELQLANRIQQDMLPSEFPAFPDRNEFDIFATMIPAKEVGGDFYDFFLIDEDHLGLVIADVSGKGIPGALLMMASKIIIGSKALDGKKPAEILADTNNIICNNNKEEMFVTVWLGILEISTGVLRAANAGHEKPVLIHADGTVEVIRDKRGFVIGGMEGMKYPEYELKLEPGAKLFLYTDGVPEATNAKLEMFGMERLETVLQEDPAVNPERILENMHNAVEIFVDGNERFDDTTMLCIEYRGQ